MTLQNNNLILFDSSTKNTRTIDSSTDSLAISANVDLSGSVQLNSSETSQVKLGGTHPVVNASYVTDTALASGFVFNIEPGTNSFTISTTNSTTHVFTVGSDPTSDFAAGDLILVSGQEHVGNNGIYQVVSVSAAPDEIEVSPTPAKAFIQAGIPYNAVSGGTIQAVTVGVLEFSSAGVLQAGYGATSALTLNTLATGAASLQASYEAGNTVVTDAGNGSVAISGTEALSVTSDGGLTVNTTGAIALDAGAASNLTVDGANLTLETTTSGNVVITAVDAMTLTQSGLGQSLTLDGEAINLNVNASSPGTGFQVDTTGSSGGGAAVGLNAGTNNLSLEGAQVFITASIDIKGHGGEATTSNVSPLALGFSPIAGENLFAYNIVRLNTSGEVLKASADSLANSRLIGATNESATAASPAVVNTVQGGVFGVRFSTAPSAGSMGSTVYLSDSIVGGGGVGTLTAPTASGSVVYELGVLAAADGTATDVPVIWMPRFIIENP